MQIFYYSMLDDLHYDSLDVSMLFRLAPVHHHHLRAFRSPLATVSQSFCTYIDILSELKPERIFLGVTKTIESGKDVEKLCHRRSPHISDVDSCHLFYS